MRVLLRFWRASIEAELEYRVNFVIAALTSTGSFLGGLLLTSLFFQQDDTLRGWTFPMACAVLGTFTLCSGFSRSVLTPNLSRVVHHVEKGTLDFLLLHPVDAQLQMSFRVFSLWGLPDVVIGVGMLAYATSHATPSPTSWALAAWCMGCGLVTLYGLWFAMASLSIWFVRVYNAAEVLRALLEAGRLPLDLYPSAWRIVLTYVLPIAFMTTVPAEMLVGDAPARWALASTVVAVLSALLSRGVWRLALRHYSSASS